MHHQTLRLAVSLVSLLSITAALWQPPAHAGPCVAVGGGRLTINPAAGNRRSKLTWKAKDKTLELLVADPRRGPTTVELLAGGSPVLTLQLTEASAAAWRSSGDPVRKWTYRGRDDPAGPDGLRTMKSRETRFVLKAREGIVDTISAPLALPILVRATDASGACFETSFSSCTRNDDRRIRCGVDAAVCSGDLAAAPGSDRVVSLDTAAATPFPEPSPTRGVNVSQQQLVVGTLADQMSMLDEAFGGAADRGGARNVRVDFRAHHWPVLGFDDPANCQWQGVGLGLESTPKLDELVAALASAGDVVLLRMSGMPALLSADCDTGCRTNNLMKPYGSSCTCNHASGSDPGGYSMFPPGVYDQAFDDFWGCVLKHYALLGVRRFEIWNEPDVPDSFRKNPADPRDEQAQFLELFERIRAALEARLGTDPDLAAIAGQIEIGGPAVSSFDGGLGTGGPLLPVLLQRVEQDGGRLDFVSFHMYASDPAAPFVKGATEQVRGWIPAGWTNTRISVNEWQTALGTHACQLEADLVSAPEAGTDPSVNCDHRGAGYAVYVLGGFARAGADVDPYVFEMFERDDLAPDDFYETGMGLLTAHGLPKPEAVAMWAASRLRGELLGADMETLGDRSFGWIAARDPDGTVHVLLGQYDSEPEMHFTRAYLAAGFDIDGLISACGCSGAGGTTEQNQCLRAVLDQVASNPVRAAALEALCPALGAGEEAAVLDGLDARDARAEVAGTPMKVSLGVAGLGCAPLRVELYELGPGTTTTESFRGAHPPPAFFGEFDGLYTDQQWRDLAASLWAEAKTPTRVYDIAPGRPLERVAVPAYGAVYLRIFAP